MQRMKEKPSYMAFLFNLCSQRIEFVNLNARQIQHGNIVLAVFGLWKKLFRKVKMRVAIVGSPCYQDETKLFPVISAFLDEHTHSNVVIVTGNMEGAERCASKFAHARGLDCIIFRPVKPVNQTVQAMMKSVYIRNKHIVDNADKVLIFWDGKSPETEHLIRYAKAQEKPTMILTF